LAGRWLVGYLDRSATLACAAGIERDHLVEGRAKDQAVLDEQRRGLKLGPLHRLGRPAGQVAGAEFPGANEVADIAGRDLRQRRKPRSAAIAAPMFPGRRERQRGGENEQRPDFACPCKHVQRRRRYVIGVSAFNSPLDRP
jgi:hypothetical protein